VEKLFEAVFFVVFLNQLAVLRVLLRVLRIANASSSADLFERRKDSVECWLFPFVPDIASCPSKVVKKP
jgi:hypothetical protein